MAQRNPIVPMAHEGTAPVEAGDLEVAAAEAGEIGIVDQPRANDPIEKAREVLDRGVAAAHDSLQRAGRSISRVSTTTVENVRKFANERPLQFVAVVAGAAFAAGVALRIWRSMRYE